MPLRLVTNKALTDNVATLTTSASHSLSAGTYITISGVDSTFNGSYTVTGTPTTTSFTYAKTATNVPSAVVSPSGSAIYATIDDTGRPAYMYDAGTDTWFAVAGKVDTGRNYTWTGAHTFSAPLVTSDIVTVNAQLRSTSASVSGALQVSGQSTLSSISSTSASVTTATITTGNITTSNVTTGNITDLNVTGKTDVSEITEKVTDLVLVTNSASPNFNDGTIFYISASPSSNFTLDAQNVPTTNGKITTMSFFTTQGSVGYYPNVFRIGGVTQTIRWAGGSVPTPTSTANDIDIFNFTLIRRSDSWVVLGNCNADF
jgi:hypothetical protein